MPFLTNSSTLGRDWIPFSRLFARICFSNSRWLACSAGAAVESGRMFPVGKHQTSVLTCRWGKRRTLYELLLIRSVSETLLEIIRRALALEFLLRRLETSNTFVTPSAFLVPNTMRYMQLSSAWLPSNEQRATCIVRCALSGTKVYATPGGCAYGAALVSSRMCLFFRSWASGRV